LREKRFDMKAAQMDDCETKVLNVARDAQHRFSKQVQQGITLIAGYGIEGDAHAGEYSQHRFLAKRLAKSPNQRQISLGRFR
jgi:hypothetical protein